MDHWQVLDDREVFANPVLRVRSERIRTPAGQETDWTVVDIVDGVAVIPIADDGGVWLIRQWRQAVREHVWELPAGRVEPGEPHEAAARRELHEEAGFEAAELRRLLTVFPLDGICRHRIHIFAARGLQPVATRHEPFEDIGISAIAPERLRQMLIAGEIACGIALAGLSHHLLGG